MLGNIILFLILSFYGCDHEASSGGEFASTSKEESSSPGSVLEEEADARVMKGDALSSAEEHVQPKDDHDLKADAPHLEVEEIQAEAVFAPCEQQNVSVELSKMEDVVELINLLPKPLSLPCLIQHFPRPLPLYATLSTLSAQPAFDDQTPRLFLLYGDLILSFVALGEESEFLEMSHVLNISQSVKGEIRFPVTREITSEEPYTNIASKDFDGSRCQGCHTDEKAAPSPFPTGSLQSSAIRPMPQMEMSLDFLKYYADQCEDLSLIRCQMLKSIFKGEVESQDFPSGMKTFF